jgi:hypothetical protein
LSAVPFDLAQNDVKSISNPARITAIGGDNGTEFYINFPQMPPGSQWVFPFTYGFMYVLDGPSYTAVKADASKVAPGGQTPILTTKVAHLAAYESDQQYNPGVVSTAVGGIPLSTFYRQVGAGGNNVVPGVPNQIIKVYAVLFSVDIAAAGAFAIVSDDAVGQIVAQINANFVHDQSYEPTIPISLGIGKGLRVSMLTGGNCGFSISYTQQ